MTILKPLTSTILLAICAGVCLGVVVVMVFELAKTCKKER